VSDRPPAVAAEDLTRRFGSRVAVDRVTFRVEPGESVALFGSNGAGKTTLLRILSSALRASSGAIRIDGLDYREDAVAIRRRIGVISHSSYLYGDLSALDNLEFFARLYAVPDAREAAGRMLAAMELDERADDAAKTFSRGMTQRLSIARSLIHDPRIVFLDEPFSGLDPHAAVVLRAALDRLRAEGRTLVMVTHDLPQGLAMSDRWLLMERGRLIDQGRSAGVDARDFENERFRIRRRAAPAGDTAP